MVLGEQLKALFPQGEILTEKRELDRRVLLPLAEKGWLALDRAALSEREWCLIQLCQSEGYQVPDNPWLTYLQGRSKPPRQLAQLQLLHIHIWSLADEADREVWLELMKQVLPQSVALVQVALFDYVFLFEQDNSVDLRTSLAEMLLAVEIDLGLKMTILVGQIWPDLVSQDWPVLFQAEQDLFSQWRVHQQKSCLLTVSQLYLWSRTRVAVFESSLYKLLLFHQMEEFVLALWQVGGVLSKAAQLLYVHRNTLQYRLDKWQDVTGLQLKELTDLTLCYQIVLGQHPSRLIDSL